MPNTMRRWIILLTLMTAGPSGVAPGQEGSKSEKQKISELINQLGVDKYRDRESAHQALLARDDAYPELRRALPTLNAEAQRRVRLILTEFDRRRVKLFLQYGREGRVDLFIEWSSLIGKNVDPEIYWQCALDIAWNLLKQSRNETEIRDWEKYSPAPTYERFLKDRPRFINENDTLETALLPTHLTIRNSSEIKGNDVRNSLLVSAGSARLDQFVSHNILFTLGDVKVNRGMKNLIVTDGNVDMRSSNDDVIAAHGKTSIVIDLRSRRIRGQPIGRRAIPSDRRNEESEYDLLYRPGEPPRRIFVPPLEGIDGPDGLADESPTRRSAMIRFFEVADIGIGLADDDEPRVTSMEANSPLAKAGLKLGDVIVAIDGTNVDNASAARRNLRRSFVRCGAEVSVNRDGKPVSLDVTFYGWELPGTKPATQK